MNDDSDSRGGDGRETGHGASPAARGSTAAEERGGTEGGGGAAGTAAEAGQAADRHAAGDGGRVIVGYWVPVAESMPDDEITVLVWDATLRDATLAFHDAEVLERRKDTGWVMAGASRVLLGVTHWCGEILEPASVQAMASADTQTPKKDGNH